MPDNASEQRERIAAVKNQICIECNICKMPTILLRPRLRMCTDENITNIYCGYCGQAYSFDFTLDKYSKK